MRFIGGGKNGKGRREIVGRPLLTSLIDVVFLLLIYFMLTSRFTQSESQLSSTLRSEQGEAGVASDMQMQIVHVQRDDDGVVRYRIGGRVVETVGQLAGVLGELPKAGGVFVKAEDGVAWAHTAGALQACEDAGFEKRTLVVGGDV